MSDQYITGLTDIFTQAAEKYNTGEEIEEVTQIPTHSASIPLDTNKWLKIPDVVCVYIDMKNSTQLSAQNHDKSTASIYQYFTDSAVRILDHFGATYIDVRGDGAFGLFNSNNLYHALAAAVTFKTFCAFELRKVIKIEEIDITCHIGMDKKTVLVKKIGLRKSEGKTDKQNEVWAGKPVNMASKLSSLGDKNDLIISERVFNKLLEDGSELVLKNCGCNGNEKAHQWKKVELNNDPKFDFTKAYRLISSGWCTTHGKEVCEKILGLDNYIYDKARY